MLQKKNSITARGLLFVLIIACSFSVCPVFGMAGDSHYITVNPVGDHAVGDIITISGTTNFPVNTTLWIQAGPKEFTKYPPHYIGETVQVVHGTDRNLWSIEVNTSTFAIDEYSVLVSPMINEDVSGSAIFRMTGRHTEPILTPSAIPAGIPERTPVPDSPAQQPATVHPVALPKTTEAPLSCILLVIALGTLVFLAGSLRK